MKPIIAASQESLMLAGKQLIESHVYTMCGVVNVDEPKEVVIYIKGMTAEELADFQDSEGTAPIRLPRYKEDGSRSRRDFNGFTYQGEIYATSRALQTVRICTIKNEGESRISTYWRPISILGELRESLILTNRTDETTKERTMKRSTEEKYNAGKRLMKFNAKLNGKPGVAVVDLGSDMCVVAQQWLKHLQEGRDFKYIKDIDLQGPGNIEIPTKGTVRVYAPAGLELTRGVKRSGFEACVVDSPQENEAWDMLVGTNFKGINTLMVPIKALFNSEMEKTVNRKIGESRKKRDEEETSRKERQRTHVTDKSRLRKIPGSKDKLWDSKDGKVTDIRLPCGYHRPLGMTPEECLDSPRHCYECSKPNKIAPPVRECTGLHQYRPSTSRKRTPPSSNNGDKKEEAFCQVNTFKIGKEKEKNEREECTGAKETTEEYTARKNKNTPLKNKRPVNKEVEEAEMNPTEEKLRSSAPSIEETKDYFEYLRKLKYQEEKELQYQADTSGEPWEETEDGTVMIQEPAEAEKPKVEPTPRSYGIIEMIAQAEYEHEELEGRIIRAKAAKGLQLKQEEMEELERLETIQAGWLARATPKQRKEELERDAWAAEVLEHSMREAEMDEDAKAAKGPQLEPEELKEPQELDRLELIKAKRHNLAKLKKKEEELAQDALAAKILEDFMKRKAEHDKVKAAAEPKEEEKSEKKPEIQEEAEGGDSGKPDSM